jgi:hypothetical protein
MKGILGIFDFLREKSFLHMKRKTLNFKSEKYFDFQKMDKKNVQILKTQIFYGKRLSPYDK